jgi:hypothetical protein
MDIDDGFVSGIYNYCNRWCERCAYTRWCRLFADSAELEAELDPNLKEVLAAPPLPEDIPPPPPREVQELIEQVNAIAAQARTPTGFNLSTAASPPRETSTR